MDNHWNINKEVNKEHVSRLSEELKIPYVLAFLLNSRGIRSYEEAMQFFQPKIGNLHDPFLMKDMDKSVERIEKAIKNKEKVLIFGDYDVDGTSATALMYSFLKQFEIELEYYIPDRYNEGYGISDMSIEYAKNNILA